MRRVRAIVITPPAICAQTDLRNLVRSDSVDLYAEHSLELGESRINGGGGGGGGGV